MLSSAERQHVLVDWNRTGTDYPRTRCVHELFEEESLAHPDVSAATYGTSHIGYGELNARANQLANYLLGVGIKPGTNVGLFLDRSLEVLVAILGVLKTGAAYAPLGSRSPPERLTGMLEDLHAPVVLTQQRLRDIAALAAHQAGNGSCARVICLDAESKAIEREPEKDPGLHVAAESLAYISFTSGSTGRPKGVCVPHRGIVRLVKNTNYASFTPSEVFLQAAPISFDASLFEIWGSLLNGGRLVLTRSQLPTLSELAELIREHGVTTAWFTTGLFNQLVDEVPEALNPLHQVLTGGDVVSPFHVRKALGFIRHGLLINGYGPTENSTFTTTYTIPKDFDGAKPVPIGRPISNTTCYILDADLEPVPIGVAGELYVGGDGLATGYLDRPELTVEKFISNPFQPGARLYKTGDEARYLGDGNIDFLGRSDLQLKIRGFRVEPGEVESKLILHPAVRRCVVTARRDATGLKQLVAYVVADNASSAEPQHWQDYLRQQVPDYMVPAFFVRIKSLPLTPNGKVDYNALPAPAPDLAADRRDAHPKNRIQAELQDILQELIELKPIGITDDFFALGGHSLLAMRLAAAVEKRLQTTISIRSVFENPTIEQIAKVIQRGQNAREVSGIIRLQPNGTRSPLLLVHGAGGGMFWGYRNLVRHLDEDQPVLAFQSHGLQGEAEPESIEALAATYLAELRRFQPQGPYYLGGYCFGGLVAYEMARRLEQAYQKVALLALINTSPPNSSYSRFSRTPVSALKFTKNLALKSAYALGSTRGKWGKFLRWRWRVIARRARTLIDRSAAAHADAEEWADLSAYPGQHQQLWRTHIRAWITYQPKPYGGRVTLFRSTVHQLYCSFDPAFGWGELARGGVEVNRISAGHDSIMEEPRVRRLGEAFRAALQKTQAAA